MRPLHFEEPSYVSGMSKGRVLLDQEKDPKDSDKLRISCAVAYELFLHYGSKVIHVDPDLARAFLDTDTNIKGALFRAPFRAQYFCFRDSYIRTVKDPNAVYEGAYLCEVNVPERRNAMGVVSVSIESGKIYLSGSQIHWDDEDDIIEMLHSADLPGVRSIIINACLYMSDPNSPPAKIIQPKLNPKTASRKSQAKRHVIGHGFIYAPGGIQGFGSGDGTGDSKRLHWVRGHWRQQWIGSKLGRTDETERRQVPRWIQPHKRGKGLAEILHREYIVK